MAAGKRNQVFVRLLDGAQALAKAHDRLLLEMDHLPHFRAA